MAVQLDIPKIKTWKGSRCDLVQRVALIRTRRMECKAAPERRTKKPKTRRQPMRDLILKLLAKVTHYEDKKGVRIKRKHEADRDPAQVFSVGMSYGEILKRVKARFPKSKISNGQLRWNAAMVRAEETGFENCTLPQKRPRTI